MCFVDVQDSQCHLLAIASQASYPANLNGCPAYGLLRQLFDTHGDLKLVAQVGVREPMTAPMTGA